jgi:alpha-glucosidase
VEAQRGDDTSVLSLYRRAVAARPSGAFAWRDASPGVLEFDRDELTCIVNVDADAIPVEGVLLASEPVEDVLPRGAAAWVRR